MSERRRHNRLIVEGMDLRARALSATEIEIINMSRSGISLFCDRRLNIGGKYTLKFSVKNKLISVKGMAVWVKLAGSKKGPKGEVIPKYSAGIEYSEDLSEDALNFIDLIERNIKVKEKRRGDLRFMIYTHEKAILKYPQSFEIKRISLSGMLVESEEDLPLEQTFPMTLTLPEDEEPITFTGRVANSRLVPERKGRSYDIGIGFDEMSEEDKLRLGEFIADLERIGNPDTWE
jgi:hypothetical protein